MNEKLPLSLVVITLNEESNIERCLKSVPFASDIVVLDSQSTDQTVSRAKDLGARTFVEAFRGYRAQKQRATELAQFDWVLSLDADEALSPGLAEEIFALWKSGEIENLDGFEMPRLSYHLGRWIHHGGWYPDRQLRLFHRKKCQWVGGHVHERVSGTRVSRLGQPIHHWVFRDLADQVQTNNEYSTRGADDLVSKGQGFSLARLVFKPWSKFAELYLWKRGFLDGLPGFVIAVGAAYSVFLKYAKLWEHQAIKGKNT